MKHESEYNTINGLAVGDDMDADAFNVVSGLDGECRNVYDILNRLDGEQTTTPRCVFFEGEVNDGDKVR